MKKLLIWLLSLLLTGGLAACGQEAAVTPVADTPETPAAAPQPDPAVPAEPTEIQTPAQTPAQTQESLPADDTPAPEGESGGVLIAYFSWSGNTAQMAQMIQTETGGDLFELTPVTPYTDDYNALLDIAQTEQSDNARPELAAQVEGWDGYEVVFVGYPNWWNDAPMIVYSFLEAYDWTGKTLIPFCTSGGSAFGRSTDKLPDSAPGATVLEGLHLSGSRVDSGGEEAASWIDGVALPEVP